MPYPRPALQFQMLIAPSIAAFSGSTCDAWVPITRISPVHQSQLPAISWINGELIPVEALRLSHILFNIRQHSQEPGALNGLRQLPLVLGTGSGYPPGQYFPLIIHKSF